MRVREKHDGPVIVFAATLVQAVGCSMPADSASESPFNADTRPALAESPGEDAGPDPNFDINGALLLKRGQLIPLPTIPGATETVPFRSNDRGQIAGYYADAAGLLRGFLWDEKATTEVTTIAVPGAATTIALDLNNRAQVVGSYAEPGVPVEPSGDSPTRGFLWEAGVLTFIDVPDATSTAAYGLNNRDQVAGHYSDAAGVQHGYVFRDGEFVTFDHPLATTRPNVTATRVLAINDRGETVGSYGDDAGMLHAYVRDKEGSFQNVEPPGSVQAEASAINNRGWIVGRYLDATPMLRGFLLTERGYTSIDIPNRCDTVALDIDERGRILIPPAGAVEGTTCLDGTTQDGAP